MEWIEAKDKLPDEYGQYLIYIKGSGIAIRLFSEGFFWKSSWDGYVMQQRKLHNKYWQEKINAPYKKVTHWMPLPKPPGWLKRT